MAEQTEPLTVLDGHIAKASALIGLYGRRANASFRTAAEVETAKREMKVIKQEILAELQQSARSLVRLRRAV